MIIYLDIVSINTICSVLVTELFTQGEPIDILNRYPGILESILDMPKQTVFGGDAYPSVFDKAVCYFYFIIKDHPFMNGNKRIAIVATYVFLYLNNYSLNVPPDMFYDLSKVIAQSKRDHKVEMNALSEFIEKHSELLAE
jgi:death-on-curing protein